VDFDIRDQLLIIFFAFVRYRGKLRIQRGSTSATHRLQETLGFSEEGSIVTTSS
jgi:hypothetical protein